MGTFTIFDNEGKTLDRFTIINSDTGDVFGSSENPDDPNGIWKFFGNCADQHTLLPGAGWRQKLPGKKVIKTEVDKFITNAKFDPGWIGKGVDFNGLPVNLRQYISKITAGGHLHRHSKADVIYMATNSDEVKSGTGTP
jgi:hypothetical protein